MMKQSVMRKLLPYGVAFVSGFLLAMSIYNTANNNAPPYLTQNGRTFTRGSRKDLPRNPFEPRAPNWTPDVETKQPPSEEEQEEEKTEKPKLNAAPVIQKILTTAKSVDLPAPPITNVAPVCKQKYGKLGIFVIYTNYAAYAHATNIMRCYANSRGYHLFLVQPFQDKESQELCKDYHGVFFRKHCVASVYLPKVDWLLVTDADTAIINANHCIEDFIDPKAEVIHYERYFTSEIAAGNYIVKNTPTAAEYLRTWAAYEKQELPPPVFTGADNGFVHLLILKSAFPEDKDMYEKCKKLQSNSTWPDYEPGYGRFIGCVKNALKTFDPKTAKPSVKIMIYARFQAWVRDTAFQDQRWWTGDFMAHGIKTAGPFQLDQLKRLKKFEQGQIPEECKNPNWIPLFTEEKHQKPTDTEVLKDQMCGGAEGMQKNTKLNPVYGSTNMRECWPKCPLVLPLPQSA